MSAVCGGLAALADWFEVNDLRLPAVIKLGGSAPRAVGSTNVGGIRTAVGAGWHLEVTNDLILAIRDFGPIRCTLEAARWDTSKRPPFDRVTQLESVS